MGADKKMSRREALARMGLIVAGAAASSIGLSALTSYAEKPQKKRIVLYFTATGNCLYAARQLVESEEQLLSIPQLVKQNRYEFEADEIGMVYPIYGHMPPNMVRNFIRKARLKAEYKFAILTYGARKCDAVEIWDDLSGRAGNPFDYIATLMMVDNWLPNFDMNEQVKMDKHIPENLQRITGDISRRRHWQEPVSEEERQMHDGFMALSGLDPKVGFLKRSEKYFTVTDTCIGCGACADVCPRGNYELTPKADEQFWFDIFRIGHWPAFNPGVQFPTDSASLDQFFRQMTPDIGSHDTKTDLASLDALFDRIGEGIIVTHSAGGFPGWMAAIENPNVRGIVSYEPGTYVFPEGEVPDPMPSLTGTLRGAGVPMADFMKLTKIPIVLYFGDYIPEEVTDELGGENWRVRLQMGRKFIEAVNRHGGNAALVELPEVGVRGNTHFPMSDLNNAEIAGLLAGWLHDSELDK